MLVSQFGERRLLARIQSRFEKIDRHSAHVVLGIGDDAAVVAPRRNTQTVLTTDAQVEGVHFDRRFSSPEDIGFRSLAVNVSDIAAMGATARWALVSLVLPDATAVAEVDGIVEGIVQLAETLGMAVIGGNLTRSPGPLMIDITAIGEVAARRVLTRSGGRPGDALYVSGTIGAAAAGLEMLKAATGLNICIDRYRRPEPRARLGVAIARARAARAAIDLSDGLADAAYSSLTPATAEWRSTRRYSRSRCRHAIGGVREELTLWSRRSAAVTTTSCSSLCLRPGAVVCGTPQRVYQSRHSLESAG